jgi:hypothetical protein
MATAQDYLNAEMKGVAGLLAELLTGVDDTGAPSLYALAGGGGSGRSAIVSVTRPNDSTAYTAGDVVGAAAAALVFPNMGPAGGEIMLTSATLEIDVTAIPSGMTTFTLRLYSVTPPSAYADNAAWDLGSGDLASYLGHIALGAPADLGSTLRIAADGINKQVKLAGTSLFAYLCSDGGYTPSALAVKVIGLHAVAL